MSKQKTYWHLEGLARKPSEYELCTSSLLYYPSRGFEVRVPIADWYAQNQQLSPLQCRNWDAFADPRETTYASYVALQKRRESFVEDLLQLIDQSAYDKKLSPEWMGKLEKILPPLRYPLHGLQMAASYAGQLAPSGRVAVAFLFQAADEMRRVDRCAYRLRQIQNTYPDFGKEGKTEWTQNPLWQPLRALIEKLLVTYDFGEAFVALNLAVKPVFDELFLTMWSALALEYGDEILSKVLYSFREDSEWQKEWSAALVRLLIADEPANRTQIRNWLDLWSARSVEALSAFAQEFNGTAPGSKPAEPGYGSFRNSLNLVEAP